MSKKKNTTPSAARPKLVVQTTTEAASTAPITASWIPGLALGILAFLLYINTLGHGYVLDDDLALRLHQNVSRGLAGIGDIFSAPYRDGCFGGCLYRPLTLAVFAVEWRFAPNNPFVGHLMNVLWFAATVVLLYATLNRLLRGWSLVLAFAATLLFVAHPVHTEVVANIKSRDEILCLFFTLLSINLFAKSLESERRSRLVVFAAIAYLCALLSKESAITVLPIFPLIAWTFYGQSAGRSVTASLWALAPVLIFFLLRGSALSGLTSPPVSYMDNPIVAATGFGERFATSWLVLGKYLGLLFAPFPLLSDYTFNTFPLAKSGNPMSLLWMAVHLGLLGWALWRLPRRNVLAFCVLAYFAGIALYSQLLTVIGTLMGERLLYSPSVWWCLALPFIAAYFLKIETRHDASWHATGFSWSHFSFREKTLALLVVAIAVLFSLKTIGRNADWKANLALFKADVAKAPNSVRLNDGYAEELYKSLADKELPEAEIERRWQLSEQHSKQSLSIEPKSLSANLNLGNLRFFKKQYAEAAAAYEKCLQIIPDYSYAKRNLAGLLIAWAREEGEKNQNPEKARQLLLRSLALDDKNAGAWHLTGVSYGVQGNHAKAAGMFEKAWAMEPDNKGFARDLVMALRAGGNAARADEVTKQAGL